MGFDLELTAARNEGSPEIVPVVDAGRHIRFAASSDQLTRDYYGRDPEGAVWAESLPAANWEELITRYATPPH